MLRGLSSLLLNLVISGWWVQSTYGHLPNNSSIQYQGRWDTQTDDYQTEWPGSKLIFSVQAKETQLTIALSAIMISNPHYFAGIEVNCQYYNRYEISSANNKLQFVISDVTPGNTYEISVVKITEASQGDAIGKMSFDTLDIVGGDLLPSSNTQSCHNQPYKLLVIGDSITAAYGVDGANEYCHYSASTQNIIESYATIVGRNVNSLVQTIAWSGKGVVRNYGDVNPTSTNPMPIYYNRTIATDSSLYWNPKNYLPDVTIIALGANDYSTQPNPSDEDFQTGLINLINQIHVDYSSTKIILVCEPGAVGHQCSNIETVALKTETVYVPIPNEVIVSFGCDYHPSVDTQINIANVVTPVVMSLLEVK